MQEEVKLKYWSILSFKFLWNSPYQLCRHCKQTNQPWVSHSCPNQDTSEYFTPVYIWFGFIFKTQPYLAFFLLLRFCFVRGHFVSFFLWLSLHSEALVQELAPWGYTGPVPWSTWGRLRRDCLLSSSHITGCWCCTQMTLPHLISSWAENHSWRAGPDICLYLAPWEYSREQEWEHVAVSPSDCESVSVSPWGQPVTLTLLQAKQVPKFPVTLLSHTT